MALASFDIAYDADEDMLEVWLGDTEEDAAQTVALNDHVVIHTDEQYTTLMGLTLYSFSRLLGVSETEFTVLKDADDATVDAILALLSKQPASYFIAITDPELLLARISGPSVEALMRPTK